MNSPTTNLFHRVTVVLCVFGFGVVNQAWAGAYSQGYETDASGWNVAGANTITRVASGGGTLGVASSSGSYHAEITNDPDGYGYAGFGDGGYTYFGGPDPVYQGSFYQRMDVYIDANWAPAAAGYEASFWIDGSPRNISNASEYGAEHNFRMTATGSQVDVRIDGGSTPIASLTSSGWYTFEMVWKKGALPTDLIQTDMNIYDSANSLVGTTTVPATAPGGPSLSSVLGNNSYQWVTVWQNGFAGDVLAIDNVETGIVPEPASLALLSMCGPMLLKRGRRA